MAQRWVTVWVAAPLATVTVADLLRDSSIFLQATNRDSGRRFAPKPFSYSSFWSIDALDLETFGIDEPNYLQLSLFLARQGFELSRSLSPDCLGTIPKWHEINSAIGGMA